MLGSWLEKLSISAVTKTGVEVMSVVFNTDDVGVANLLSVK